MKYRIYDTGIYSKDNITGTVASNANRAGYNGTSAVNYFEMDVEKAVRNASANTDDAPTPGNYTTPEVNYVSFETATYTLSCVMSRDPPTGITYQYNILYQLARLEKTKGIKLIYPSNTTDTRKGIIELLGAYNGVNGVFQGSGKTLTAGSVYISGRVKQVSGITEDPKSSLFRFNIIFQCVEEIQD